MNKNTKMFVSALAISAGLFAGAFNISYAQYKDPSYASYDAAADYTYTGSVKAYSPDNSISPSTASTDSQNVVSHCDSATLYGAVFAQNATVSAWFEWGNTSSLGLSTSRQTFTSNSSYHANISGLHEDTTYYWRAVASSNGSTMRGDLMNFRTPRCATPVTVTPTQPTNPAPSTPTNTNPMIGNYNVSCSTISGSVYNANSPSSSVTVSIYNGVPNMSNVSVVGTAVTNSSNHSFSLNTPASIKNGNTYQIWALADGILFDNYEYFNSSDCATASPVISNSNIVSNTNNIISNSVDSNILNNSNNNVINSNNTTNIVTFIPDNGGGSGNNNDTPSVTTKSATSISTGSATLNGQVDGNGSSTNVWFEWGDDRNDLNETTSQRSVGSGTTTFNSHISGLRRDTTYYFRAVAENDEGSDEGSILSFRTDDNGNSNNGDAPDVTTKSATNITQTSATLRGEVDGNGSSTRAWFEWSTDRNNLSKETDDQTTGSGTDTFDERITGLRNNTTYYFRAVAENDEDTDNGSVLSFRTGNNGNGTGNDFSNSISATTTPATGVTSSTAQLNSLILSNTNDDADTWFEWGTSTSLGNRTAAVHVTNDSFRNLQTITGLNSGRVYYFRAVAENSDWRSNGNILSFVTPTGIVAGASTSNVVRTTTIVNRSTGENSLVMLTIDCGSEFVTSNERRECQVEWKNISGETLRDVVLQVVLPKRMSFEAATDGDIKNDDNTLAFDIGTLKVEDEGKLAFVFKTDNLIENDGLMVIVAQLVYTEPNGVTGDALAYSKHSTYTGGSTLGAFAFGAGFLPNSLFGWLLLLILILILLVLAKQAMKRPTPTPVVITTPPPQH